MLIRRSCWNVCARIILGIALLPFTASCRDEAEKHEKDDSAQYASISLGHYGAPLYEAEEPKKAQSFLCPPVQETPIIMIWRWRVVRVVFHGDLLLLKGLY